MKHLLHLTSRLAALLAAGIILTPAVATAAVHYYTVTTADDYGYGSLRYAMDSAMDSAITASANGVAGDEYVVKFSISGIAGMMHTIKPATALPEVDESITIDGTTQSG